MKTLLLALIITIVGTAFGDGLPSVPYIYAVGMAEKDLPADRIRVKFSLESEDKNPKVATKAVEDKTRKALEILKRFGVQKNDISAASIDMSLDYDYTDSSRRKFAGYDVKRDISFTLRDVKRYGELGRSLMELPVDEFSLDSEGSSKEDVIGGQLTAEALANAKKNAMKRAAALNCEIVGVFAISPFPLKDLSDEWPGGGSESVLTLSPFSVSSGNSKSITFVLPPVKIRREAHVIFLIKNLPVKCSVHTAKPATAPAQ